METTRSEVKEQRSDRVLTAIAALMIIGTILTTAFLLGLVAG